MGKDNIKVGIKEIKFDDLFGSRWVTVAGYCECGTESTTFIKSGIFLPS